ncbi:MAG TPA: pitrilysin family protein [Thermoanaerobaculia bacterium]|nr:pitrilysin family protein [Thermoanaerobaculia bacterium]
MKNILVSHLRPSMLPNKGLFRYAPIAALAALLASPQAVVAEPVPAKPDQLVFKPFVYVPPAAKDHRTVLKSGVVAYLAENHELPLVNIQILLKGGTYLNPPGKEGLAELTGYLLARGGTKNRKAEDLEERLAFLAAQLNSAYGEDRGTVSLNLLAKDLDEGLAILREVLTEPRFQDDKLKLRKDQTLADMKQRNDSSADIERRERSFLSYGDDFYLNRFETKASLEGLLREDLVAFHRKWVDPKNVLVAAAGDFKKADMAAKLDKLLANWPFKSEAAPPVPKPSHTMTPGTVLVDKDVNQGRVSIMLPGLLRTDPDFFAAAVMNDILGGGGFTSRITNRVRSDEGLAYSAGSMLQPGIWYPGRFGAAFQSKVRTAAYASQIVIEEITKLRDGDVTDEELETAKRSFIDTLPRRFSTPVQVTGLLAEEEFTGRYASDPGYYAKYQANVEKVTKADVKRQAQRLLKPDAVTLLVVGKKADLLNPDPKHPVKFADLTSGKLAEVPLRDPLTMKPMAVGSAK